ncbi:hypothetical protein C8R44DRAFT_982835 [Mycena epipterygia]|nr:hypothetical protein C8R44DRAFT_982835 [Mycena epipterygia]
MPPPATSMLELRALSAATLPVFSTGCTVDLGHNDTLAPCCAAVGSTPVEVDGTFGCPYTSAFVPAANQTFGTCALAHGAGSSCAPASPQNAAARLGSLRWQSAPALVLVVGILAMLL